MFTVDFPAYGVRVKWNGSATFNVYVLQWDTWRAVDTFTVYGVADRYDAMAVALEHLRESDEYVAMYVDSDTLTVMGV